MSYARFTDASDVYIYMSVYGYLECCACCMSSDRCYTATSTEKMVEHLQEHTAMGHKVPDYVIPDLRRDDMENFPIQPELPFSQVISPEGIEEPTQEGEPIGYNP